MARRLRYSEDGIGFAPPDWQALMRIRSQTSLLGLTTLLVTAACGDDSGPAATVDPVVARVEISDALVLQLVVGETRQLTAAAFDDQGEPVTAPTVSWRSGDAGVATVDAEGLVTAVDAGGTRIFAESGVAADSVPISVFDDSNGTGGGGG